MNPLLTSFFDVPGFLLSVLISSLRSDLLTLISLSLDNFTTALLYGVKKLTASDNKLILESTIDFIRKSKRFSKLEAF